MPLVDCPEPKCGRKVWVLTKQGNILADHNMGYGQILAPRPCPMSGKKAPIDRSKPSPTCPSCGLSSRGFEPRVLRLRQPVDCPRCGEGPWIPKRDVLSTQSIDSPLSEEDREKLSEFVGRYTGGN